MWARAKGEDDGGGGEKNQLRHPISSENRSK